MAYKRMKFIGSTNAVTTSNDGEMVSQPTGVINALIVYTSERYTSSDKISLRIEKSGDSINVFNSMEIVQLKKLMSEISSQRKLQQKTMHFQLMQAFETDTILDGQGTPQACSIDYTTTAGERLAGNGGLINSGFVIPLGNLNFSAGDKVHLTIKKSSGTEYSAKVFLVEYQGSDPTMDYTYSLIEQENDVSNFQKVDFYILNCEQVWATGDYSSITFNVTGNLKIRGEQTDIDVDLEPLLIHRSYENSSDDTVSRPILISELDGISENISIELNLEEEDGITVNGYIGRLREF